MVRKILKEQVGGVLDRYSGKDGLNQEIEKLQSRILEMKVDVRRLEKCERKLKAAVSDRQIAEEKLNAASNRIETLEHELGKRREEEEPALSLYTETVSLPAMREITAELAGLRGENGQYVTLAVPPGTGPEHRDLDVFIDPATLGIISTIRNETGMILFYDRPGIVREIFLPPLEIEQPVFAAADRFDTEVIRFPDEDLVILIIAAHAGESLLLTATPGGGKEDSRVVRSSVKAKHGKGGFSQRRFERLREEDIAHHVEKVRGVLNEFKGQPDRIILCGDLLLAEEIVKGVELPVTPVSRKIDARIDTKNPENILREILSYRRYRL